MNADIYINNSIYRDGYLANTGGPNSRTRRERLTSSLLGPGIGAVRCPLILKVGLLFPNGSSPVETVASILSDAGFGTPEELRAGCVLPAGPLMARVSDDGSWRLDVMTSEPRAVLVQAVILGLCTSFLYDPGRRVLWTETSLGRALELFDPTGFYA